MEYVLGPVIREWAKQGYGFCMKAEGEGASDGLLINHAACADNIILFANSEIMMRHMIEQLDTALFEFWRHNRQRYFEWKADSLEYMAAGPLKDEEPTGFTLQHDNQQLRHQHIFF